VKKLEKNHATPLKRTLTAATLALLLGLSLISIYLYISLGKPNNELLGNSGTEVRVINTLTGDGNFTFDTKTTDVNYTFIANVTVFNVTELYSWQLNITWDPTMLDLLAMTLPPDHVFSNWTYYTAPTNPDINHTAGYALWSVLSAAGQPSFNGTGTLVQLEFNITAVPDPGEALTCNITIDTQGDFYSYLLDPEVNEIPFTPINGAYKYEWIVELKIINPLTGDGNFTFTTNEKEIGDTFIANVTVFDVGNLFSWQLNITWDPSVLNLVNATLPPDHVFAGQPIYPTDVLVNNTSGDMLWFVGLAFGQPSFNGTGTLTQLEFNITGVPDPGEALTCNITIDTEGDFYSYLLDPEVNEIPFTPTNGIFKYTWAPSVLLISPTETQPTYVQAGKNITVTYNYTDPEPKNVTITVYNSTSTIGTANFTDLANGTNIERQDVVPLSELAADGAYNVKVTLWSNLTDIPGEDVELNAVIVDNTPPEIQNVTQSPPADSVYKTDEVHVNATVTDTSSGVKQVILSYTTNETWINVTMTKLVGNIYNATIPQFEYCTNVTYKIIAEDNAGNVISTEDLGYEYKYHVIPEFPVTALLIPVLLALAAVMILMKKRHLI